jgi:hypothetical protein
MKVTWKPYKVLIGLQTIDLEPGQMVFGLKKAAKATKLSISSIRRIISVLISEQNIALKTTNKFSILTICNWDTYQCDEKENSTQNNKQTANKRQTNGNIQEVKELKEHKEEKNKEKRLYGEHVLLSEIEYNKLCEKWGNTITDDWITRLNEYAGSKPKKFKEYASHYLTLLGWDRMKQERDRTGNVKSVLVRTLPETKKPLSPYICKVCGQGQKVCKCETFSPETEL